MFESFADTMVDKLGETTYILPETCILVAALISPLLFFLTKNGKVPAAAAFVLTGAAGALTLLMMHTKTYGTAFGLFEFNAFSSLMIVLFCLVAGLTIFVSPFHAETTKHQGEFYALIMAATAGMMFAASANSLIAIFVSVELVSITSYATVALKKNDPRAAEAAVKYLLIGAFSTALTLYGMSMIYGSLGTITLSEMSAAFDAKGVTWPLLAGVVALIAGYGFKIAAVPFHSWAPDVYEGASTPVSGFLATASKKMGFAVLFKIFFAIFIMAKAVQYEPIQYIFAIIAVITMTFGNMVAISQTNIKRMLAYSSIAQAGYIAIALAVMSQYVVTGALFHMFTHVVMKGGAFVIVAALITAGVGEKISDYRGLAKRAPLIAAAMMLCLFSLAGIPPLAGFTSKFILFSGAIYVNGEVDTTWLGLILIAVLNSAMSLYYYARVVKAMYIESGESTEKLKIHPVFMIAIALCVIGVIVMGVYPQPLIRLCSTAAKALFLI